MSVNDSKRVWTRWIIGVLVAVGVSWLMTSYTARDNLVAGCIRNSEFKNQVAGAWERASAQRQEDGDADTGLFYKNTAYSIRLTIPVSNNYVGLRGQVMDDRRKGCKDSFPAPIPFIE
jgi:hypothetical protein